MAFFAKQFSHFLVLILTLQSTTLHARDSQFFNKIPTTTNTPVATTTTSTSTDNTLSNTNQLPNNQNQKEQEPVFNFQNENSYGLYSQETGQLSPSTTTKTQVPLNKHLPKNYNPVAYVTVPEDNKNEFTDEKSFATNPSNYNNNAAHQNYYNTFQQQQEEEPEYRNYHSTTTPNYENNNDNYNYEKFNYMSGGSSFNSQPQGMSDTRFMENGKYFYDVNNEKYSNNHPYESLKRVQPMHEFSNNMNFYGNNGNGNEFGRNKNFYGNRGNGNEYGNVNYMGGNGYQNQAEFQNEDNYNMP